MLFKGGRVKVFKEKFESIKAMVTQKTEGNNKKKIENLVVFLIILVITIIVINVIWNEDTNNNNTDEVTAHKELAVLDNNADNVPLDQTSSDSLEGRLENILSNISGVRRG